MKAINSDQLESLPWTSWEKMPTPKDCRLIIGPQNAGVYQIRLSITSQKIQFGIGVRCQHRMKSLYPKPFGSGTRNNEHKRQEVLNNWKSFEYRTLSTETKDVAKIVEKFLKSKNDHKYNT